jgi:hypothetical protein
MRTIDVYAPSSDVSEILFDQVLFKGQGRRETKRISALSEGLLKETSWIVRSTVVNTTTNPTQPHFSISLLICCKNRKLHILLFLLHRNISTAAKQHVERSKNLAPRLCSVRRAPASLSISVSSSPVSGRLAGFENSL